MANNLIQCQMPIPFVAADAFPASFSRLTADISASSRVAGALG